MVRKHYKKYKPKKKTYTKTQKFLYHTGKALGEAKTALQKGYKKAEKVAPKVSRYFKTTRGELAREFGEPQMEQRR